MRCQIPAKSQAQQRFFEYLAHNPGAAKEHGMTAPAAKEYVSHNVGSKSYSNLPKVASSKVPSGEELAPPMKRFHSLFNK